MIFNNVILTATNQADIEQIASLLSEQAAMSEQEPGCVRFEVYQSQSEPDIFVLVEQWQSQSHLDEHRQAPAFTDIYMPKVLPLVTRTAHPCTRIWPPESA